MAAQDTTPDAPAHTPGTSKTGFGGTRIVDMLVGGQLPRIVLAQSAF